MPEALLLHLPADPAGIRFWLAAGPTWQITEATSTRVTVVQATAHRTQDALILLPGDVLAIPGSGIWRLTDPASCQVTKVPAASLPARMLTSSPFGPARQDDPVLAPA